GVLVDELSKSFQTKNKTNLHQLIRLEVGPYLYNDGKGRDIPIKELVERRHRERTNKALSTRANHKYPLANLKRTLDAPFVYTENGDTRFCCWDINKRGPLGETAFHICLLNNSTKHNMLAMEMVEVFPNLLVDIYLGDEYYGENVLHMAIANEDMSMIKFILEESKKVEERCCGSFFCPSDQKSTRVDQPDKEQPLLSKETNYSGLIYWGEYPMMFAACSMQVGAFELLLREGADIYATDSNLNNVLHMMVIHNNKEMFNLAFNHAGMDLLSQTNKQGLTPLTLCAKLGNKDMLDHILELKREISWVFGDVTCATYPLSDVDTINPTDGSINSHSALSIILSEESNEHLEMLDGLLFQLLHEKWKHYAKVQFYVKAVFFILYLVAFITAIYLQPPPQIMIYFFYQISLTIYIYCQEKFFYNFIRVKKRQVLTDFSEITNNTVISANTSLGLVNISVVDQCYLLSTSSATQIFRYVLECIVVISAVVYLVVAVLEIYNEGKETFWWTIYNTPMKGSFLISCVLVLLIIPCRFTCHLLSENVILTLCICTCIPYLLFFCRGFKLVGPFIVAIYNMIMGDLLRFLILYSIFLMGFSQAMYIVFRGTGHPLFSHPFQSIMGMFIITLGEFSDLYLDFEQARHPAAAKVLFVIYMVIVTVLLINMLIAMMGNTFNKIAATRWEWQRQWAKIVLVMERSVSAEHRIKKQRIYSQPDSKGNGRRFVV
uniref:Ion transport domain-containing protein n=1 Tax=Ciona savignyi TaxID=51511 RepID=H2Z593_CIOSA